MLSAGVLTVVLSAALQTTPGAVLHANASPILGAVTVSGPIVGHPYPSADFDISGQGYTEKEYFLSGSAHSYGAARPDAPYTTRMIVYRPLDATQFSGNVVVEWNNVSSFNDAPVDLQWVHQQVIDEGDAYVAVSVQQAGICGPGQGRLPAPGFGSMPCIPTSLAGHDPARYGRLDLPGDDYSSGIFSQAAASLRNRNGADPLEGLIPNTVLAIGVSQSALALDDYIKSGADDSARVFDGFLIDADSQATLPSSYRVPTLHLWSEDAARPGVDESKANHVSWQIAGAPHVDRWANSFSDSTGTRGNATPVTAPEIPSVDNLGNYGQEGPTGAVPCIGGSEFPRRYAVDAALAALQVWVHSGIEPPRAPALEFTGIAESVQGAPTLPDIAGLPLDGVNAAALLVSPVAIARDAYGNALGGLRLPVVTVPVAGYVGSACVLLGTSTPLPANVLHELYPTHSVYVDKLLVDTRKAVQDRFMTAADGRDLIERACVSAIPSWGTTPSEQRPETCLNIEAQLRNRESDIARPDDAVPTREG